MGFRTGTQFKGKKCTAWWGHKKKRSKGKATRKRGRVLGLPVWGRDT